MIKKLQHYIQYKNKKNKFKQENELKQCKTFAIIKKKKSIQLYILKIIMLYQ